MMRKEIIISIIKHKIEEEAIMLNYWKNNDLQLQDETLKEKFVEASYNKIMGMYSVLGQILINYTISNYVEDWEKIRDYMASKFNAEHIAVQHPTLLIKMLKNSGL